MMLALPATAEDIATSYYSGENDRTFLNSNSAVLAEPKLNVLVDGIAVQWTDAEPFIDENSRTMVPLRAVGDALGLTVDWDNPTRTASFSDGTKTLYFPIDSNIARASDGSTITMDTAAVIVNNRIYAPVRYLAEYFGYTVEWDGVNRNVIIRYENSSASSEGPDPASVMLAIADKEVQEMLDGITEERIVILHSDDTEIINAALAYKEAMRLANMETTLYTVNISSKLGSVQGSLNQREQYYNMLQSSLQGLIKAYGVFPAAFASSFNRDNSYNYTWDSSELPLYIVVKSIEGQACAVVIGFFNENDAIETVTQPTFLSGIDDSHVAQWLLDGIVGETVGARERELNAAIEDALADGRISESLLKKAEGDPLALLELLTIVTDGNMEFPEIHRLELDPLSEADAAKLLRVLVPAQKKKDSAESYAIALAKAIADKAVPLYLKDTDGAVFDLCMSCSVFGGTPSHTIRWDISSVDGFPEDEFTYVLINSLPALLSESDYQWAAQSTMRTSTSISGLEEENAIYWLLYYDDSQDSDDIDEMLICSVSVIKNANGCYDLTAVPLFPNETLVSILEQAWQGTLTLNDLLTHVAGATALQSN